MNWLIFVNLYFLAYFSRLAFGEPFGCNKISSNAFVQIDEKNNLTVSVIAEVLEYDSQLNSWISITNFSYNGSTEIKNPSIGITFNDFDNKYVNFPVTAEGVVTAFENNSSFSLLASFNRALVPMFDGIFDEGSFSPEFSGLFSNEKPCFETDFDVSANICCLSFFKVPETKNSTVTPKCKQFKSQSILYNATDNYSIIASSEMHYNITKTQITTSGSSNVPQYYGITYKINGNDDAFGYCNDLNLPSLNCTYMIPDGNMKILFTNQFVNHGNPQLPEIPTNKTAKLGRIIFRNGLTLMEEGKPFTKNDNCLYNNDATFEKYLLYNQFCCQVFDN